MEKPITFKNKRGKQLVGMLHIPTGKKKFPLVVVCHGFGGSKTGRKYMKLARILEKNKIATFRFDFEGCGDSEGNLETITVKRQVSDLESAVNWAIKQKNINKNKIALLGNSLGAVIAILYAVRTKFSVKTIIFWAPALNQRKLIPFWSTKKDLKKWKRQGYFIRKEDKIGINYLRENEKKDYSLVFSKINAPILIIHGDKDDVVPLRFSKNLAKKYKNIKLITLPKADHKFEDYFVQQNLIKETAWWFKGYL